MFGIISDESFNKQLEELESHSSAKVVNIERGRGTGNKEVPIEIKKIISEEALNGTPARELSSAFGVSESSISAYKHSATSTSTYHAAEPELKEHNDSVRERITIGARAKLLMAMDEITSEKLSNAKVRDVASVAKDMSAIIKNIEPQSESSGLKQQFIFYAPRVREEKDFDMIEERQ